MKVFEEMASRLSARGCELCALYCDCNDDQPEVAGVASLLVIRDADGIYYAAKLGWAFTAGSGAPVTLSRFTDSLDRVKSWRSFGGALNACKRAIDAYSRKVESWPRKYRKINYQLINA